MTEQKKEQPKEEEVYVVRPKLDGPPRERIIEITGVVYVRGEGATNKTKPDVYATVKDSVDAGALNVSIASFDN